MCFDYKKKTFMMTPLPRWDPLPSMHEGRRSFVCTSIGGCVIAAEGRCRDSDTTEGNSYTTEVYEEALGRWRQLPCYLLNAEM